ncbi:MAG: 50S ribosomal protein L35 [Parcubacteria group bacterium GW2011_GWE2_39_37]|nr:MAG: 50S ribosomal protein L35 [Parcubacteria group bacterium GW2011_GWE2_39_37]
MPKIKTHKATAKRFVVTKTKKITHRKPGQDHFNARENGNAGRKKKRDSEASSVYARTIRTVTQTQ